MLELTRGSLFDAAAEAIVNPVNCRGVMGRGLALAFRTTFPDNFVAYKLVCAAGTLRPGTVFTFDCGDGETPRYLINLPTKDHFLRPSKMAYIDTGLAALVAEVQALDLRSIAIPALGCGLGGLDWSDVRPRIEAAFAPFPGIHVLLFEPNEA